MSCGKSATITVPKGGYRCTCDGGRGHWHYFGEMNVASMVTSKYFYEWDVKRCRKGRRIPNPRYDPKAKPKNVELWECHDCFFEEDEEERSKGLVSRKYM